MGRCDNENRWAVVYLCRKRGGATGSEELLIAQRRAVIRYAAERSLQVIYERIEHLGTGRRKRPELTVALETCHARGALLLIADFDRNKNDVAFLSQLAEGGVDLVAPEAPGLNRADIGALLERAQQAFSLRSKWVKASLALAKARGVKLGGKGLWPPDAAARTKATAAQRAKADAQAIELASAIAEIRAGGPQTLRGIAAALNQRQLASPRLSEKGWSPMQVKRLLERLSKLKP